MTPTALVRALAMAVLAGVLASGCATATSTSCRPGDPSLACCIQKFPLSPNESCAASEAAAVPIPEGIRMGIEEDDFANNADLPEWKQECIRAYVGCKRMRWQGNCYDCLRLCEGQRKWPGGCPSPD